ncbi:class I SAM-dependent methyltransferase [Hymenobacter algoricola]|uniref:Class I SAM-dependent methyltransferase n=1 Tax=Hymenobacter algoricola TaxID=486267 RepID=A0ABP7MRQ8_9BACT
MKRIHVFELEDFAWFPNWLRACLTKLMVVMHQMVGSPEDLARLIGKALQHSHKHTIVDLCSGSGGPMLQVFEKLKSQPGMADLHLTLTDLYPNQEVATEVNNSQTPNLAYHLAAVNAAEVPADLIGVRTLVGSFHHMPPETARRILQDAQASQQPICIYEISDNSLPTALWWISLPLIFLMSFFITPFARSLTWKQLAFTYLLPIIPLCFAWDGAVSNVRTYTLEDLDSLLNGLETEHYTWEKGRITGRVKKLYLLGMPKA